MLSRRRALVLLASVVPGVAIGCRSGSDGTDDGPPTSGTTATSDTGTTFDPEAVAESRTRFPRTPIAGDMTDSSVVLAFHVADDSAVTLRVWTAEALVVDQAIEPSGDGFHKVFLRDLDAGTTYHYALFSGEEPAYTDRSLIGQVRTAAAPGEEPVVRLALLACIGQGTILPDFYQPAEAAFPTEAPFEWELFRSVAEVEVDGLVHLGDQAYLDFVWSDEGGTEEAYLNAWGFYHGGGYRDLYPRAGLYASRDDHESTNNGDFDPWDISSEDAAKLANAHAAWFKTMPIDATEVGPIWRSFRWGDTVELVLLDCRYELEEDHQMSEEQLLFLLDRLENSPCRFICVATPKPFADIFEWTGIGEDNAERWATYPADRDRVTELLDRLEARHVVFVCGDIHMNYLGRTSITGDAVSQTRTEVCVTSGNINPSYLSMPADQFDYVSAEPSFPVLTFDPAAGTVHVAFYLADGSVGFEKTLDDV